MPHYLSAFIAIPLAQRYLEKFESAQQYLREISSHFKLTYSPSPHFTLFYIGDCNELIIEASAEIVRSHIHLLRETSLVVHGIGTFGEAEPKVLFLKANASPAVYDFATAIRSDFVQNLQLDTSLPFNPHLTLARLQTEESSRDFHFYRSTIKEHFADWMFAFPLTEVVIYAKLPGEEQIVHKKILALSIE